MSALQGVRVATLQHTLAVLAEEGLVVLRQRPAPGHASAAMAMSPQASAARRNHRSSGGGP